MLFLWRRITTNSGGPGYRRGGQGIDQAYVLRGASPFAGFANMACTDVPPPGVGGGLPPSTSQHFPIRGALAGGLPEHQVLGPGALGGTRERVRKKIGQFLFRPGDVMHAVCGGGGGVGDPLLRPVELVAVDLRDGYITVEHAAAAYGVVADRDGRIDADATARRRSAMREARIGRVPEREAAIPEMPGLAVVIGEDEDERCWSCAYCDARIAALEDDWREHVVAQERPIAELYGELHMHVRAREAGPRISVVRSYCGSCAACVAADVVSDRFSPRSPSLLAASGVADPLLG